MRQTLHCGTQPTAALLHLHPSVQVYVGSYRGSQVAIKVLLSGGSLADPQTALQGCTQSHPIMAGLQKVGGRRAARAGAAQLRGVAAGHSCSMPFRVSRICTFPPSAPRLQEAGIMAKLNHPNCLRLLGVVTSPIPAMVTGALGQWVVGCCQVPFHHARSPCTTPPLAPPAPEYCARGSLCDVLRQARQEPGSPLAASLTLARRLAMALDAARGVQYLHSHTPPILHRDLKVGSVGR